MHSCFSSNGVGQLYRSFEITHYRPLEELQLTLIELVHVPTGARVLHLAAPDDENLFCISFQTLPSSSNGAAHILEHTVLCGSRKFPVKDPFFSMSRRSLNTYMNALTGQDFTCYPASSQGKTDFYNLLSVYLDAVFFPTLRKESFLQEGHRLALDPIRIEGVVYNEMKGAMSGADDRMAQLIYKHLLPDLPYAFNSGGDPKEIPSLTHEELLEFHRLFYHPSRALFFFYGNLPLTDHLDFLEKELFSSPFFKEAPLSPLPLQKRFDAPLSVTDLYPAHGADDKPMVAFSWLTTSIARQDEVLALHLLDSLLMDTDASPLKKALLRSGLCAEADSSLDAEISEIPWILLCKGCEPESSSKLHRVIVETLKSCAEKGFKREDIEASLHQLEFERKEIGGHGGPYGLTLFFRSALLKQHGVEAERGLLIHSLFAHLRSQLENGDFLPQLIRRHLLENSHLVIATLYPDRGLHAREKEEEDERLAFLEKKMSDEEKQALEDQTKNLALFQEASEHQSLSCLPKLHIKEAPPHAKKIELKQEGSVFYHPCFTNGIIYADLVLKLPFCRKEDLPLLSLYSRFLPEVGCGGKSYEEALNLQQRYTGGISTSLSLNPSCDHPDVLQPTLTLHGKALAQNAPVLFELLTQMVIQPDFKDRERLEELEEEHLSSLKHRLVKKALSYAAGCALENHSLVSAIQNRWSGFSYSQWALKTGLPSLEDFRQMHETLLTSSAAHLVLTCSEKDKAGLPLLDLPLKRGGSAWQNPSLFAPLPTHMAISIPASVAYTAQGTKAPHYTSRQAPPLFLAAELLGNTALHKAIREKGGAYGSGASYNPLAGTFYLYAYRDPHLARTLKAFEEALDKVRSRKFSKEELEEAKLCALQSLDAPIPIGQRGAVAHGWLLTGRSFEKRDAFRKALLSSTAEEVADALDGLLEKSSFTISTFLGEELFAREKEKLPILFEKITSEK